MEKFPYLSLISCTPYFYGHGWAIFSPNENKRLDTRFEADYGVGFTFKDNRYKLQFSLFNFSRERKVGVFGPIKFSF